MDSKISRIPKIPTRLATTKRVLSELNLNAATSAAAATAEEQQPAKKPLPPPARKFLSRRSKSCADFTKPQLNGFKSALTTRTYTLNKKPPTKSTDDLRSKTGTLKKVEPAKPRVVLPVKRKPEKAEEPKPKVARVTKPAPYDYKARYNLLLEKFNKVVETQKEQKQHFGQLEQQAAEYKVFQSKHEDCDLIKEKCKNLEIEVPTLKKELRVAKREVYNLSTQVEELKQDNKELSNNYSAEKQLTERLTTENQNLKDELTEHRELRRRLHNTLQDLKGTIRVYCRIRPVSQKESDRAICSFTFMDETSFEIKKNDENNTSHTTKSEFSFDKVFTPSASQNEVFEDLSELIQSALDGYNICVFAYGQTGAGKTYTMQGEYTPSGRGMIPRSIELIFARIAKMALTGWKYEVSASFLEIYNENINDLLNPGGNLKYEIYYNEGKGTTVSNLKTQPISSAEELMEVMRAAHKNRAVACTNFNEHSSRSHAVTKIMLMGKHEDSKDVYMGSVSLVDLAGSESAKTSDRLNETKNINKSLSALGSVMLALYNKDPHVPYRNSKLTYLLQSSLGGNSKTVMFVNVSPFEDCFGESISSLRFASKVKEVKISSKKNRVYKMDKDSLKTV